jgi:hypothetical protein
MASNDTALAFTRTIDAKPNEHSIVKPGELVDLRETTPLTLNDKRIYNELIANAWDAIGTPQQHSIPKANLVMSEHKGHERLTESVKRLMVAIVEVRVQREKKWETRRVQLLGANTIPDSDDGMVHYSFDPLMLEIINESSVFARLQRQIMFALSSKYALTLYEIVQKRGNMKRHSEIFEMDDFRAIMGVPKGKLSSWINFKNRAVTPAVEEVSKLSDFIVTVEPMTKVKRFYTQVQLKWIRKPKEDLPSVERELNSHRLGRKERLAGTVERVSFGAGDGRIPSLSGETMLRAKELLPGYDVYYVEMEWRKWASDKELPNNPDGAFLAFCKIYGKNNPLN